MNSPIHIVDLLPAEHKQSDDAAIVRLHAAYAAFMAGNPSREDCSVIAIDLALHSGYYNTTAMELPAEQSKYCDGQRSVYGRIVRMANMPMIEIEAHQRKVLELQNMMGDFN